MGSDPVEDTARSSSMSWDEPDRKPSGQAVVEEGRRPLCIREEPGRPGVLMVPACLLRPGHHLALIGDPVVTNVYQRFERASREAVVWVEMRDANGKHVRMRCQPASGVATKTSVEFLPHQGEEYP